MTVPEPLIEAAVREAEKCEWLLEHINKIQAMTRVYSCPEIGEQKNTLKKRLLENITFVNHANKTNIENG